jgi:hypothetical protein
MERHRLLLFKGLHLEAVSEGHKVVNFSGLSMEEEQGSIKSLDKRISLNLLRIIICKKKTEGSKAAATVVRA